MIPFALQIFHDNQTKMTLKTADIFEFNNHVYTVLYANPPCEADKQKGLNVFCKSLINREEFSVFIPEGAPFHEMSLVDAIDRINELKFENTLDNLPVAEPSPTNEAESSLHYYKRNLEEMTHNYEKCNQLLTEKLEVLKGLKDRISNLEIENHSLRYISIQFATTNKTLIKHIDSMTDDSIEFQA